MHIKDYLLIEECDLKIFHFEIAKLLKDGWQLHGPTQVIQTMIKNAYDVPVTETSYYQAMVLLKKEKEE